MDQPQLAVFKYNHGGRASISGKRKVFLVASLILALALSILAFPAGLLACIVPLLAYFGGARTLCVGPRYLICGDEIVYYANVTQIKLSEAAGSLSLQTASGKTLLIERAKFPTSARKANKIAANQAAKFNKVSAKIVDKVRRASPALAATAA
jgi:hypothetical protein